MYGWLGAGIRTLNHQVLKHCLASGVVLKTFFSSDCRSDYVTVLWTTGLCVNVYALFSALIFLNPENISFCYKKL